MRRSLAALALAVVLPLPSLAPASALANVVVKPGETLSEIADRHGVSITRLMQANGITNPNMVVAGQRLVLPGARSSTGASNASARSGSVTVQPGETLSEIADRQGVSVTRLMQANGITNPNMVVAGQKLVVPGTRSTTSAAAPRPLPTAPYTVKSGETLSEIADRFGTSTERLIQLNRIGNPNMVVAGTRLAIPGRPASASAARNTPAPRNAAPRNAKEHVVRSGESLSTIADSYGLPVEKLVAINKIDDPDLVVSGTRLKLQAPPPVPATAKPPAKAPVKAAAKPVAQPKPKPATTAAAPAAPKPAAPKAVVTATATPTATPTPTPRATPKPTTATVEATPQPAATTQAPAQTVAQARPTSNTTSPAQASPASRSTAIKPSTSIAAATTGVSPTTAVAAATATPQPTTSKPVSTATRAATTRPSATSKAGSSKAQGPDWRSYGPLQVDWANWQPMGGSYVAPTLNGDGKPVYLAVNCGARKLNATSQTGQWKSWDAPQTDFEEQLISDICKARAS